MIFDKIENAKSYYCMGPAWEFAFRLMENYKPEAFEKGKKSFENGVSLVQLEYQTKPAADACMEAHRKFADIMFMPQGDETLFYKPANEFRKITKPYSEEIEALLAEKDDDVCALHLRPGFFAVFLPQDGHTAGVDWGESKTVRRNVIKVPLD